MVKRLAITGSSGYLGSRIVEYFREQGVTVWGMDVRPPANVGPDEFVLADIRDQSWKQSLQSFQPDTIIHGAFVFQPIRNLKRMRDINVGGSENVMELVEQVMPRRFMLISSATAYGAWPDNPIPIREDWPLRASKEYQYAADKTEIDERLAEFAQRVAEIRVSCVRPAIIGGPHMNNFLDRFIFGFPILAQLDGYDTPLQFVHEDDVVGAIDAILAADGRGTYNLAPPNWTPISRIAWKLKRRIIRIPYRVAWFAAWLAWSVHLWCHESPPGFLAFARYPWAVAPDRLTKELGYRFRYSSTETVAEIIKHKFGETS